MITRRRRKSNGLQTQRRAFPLHTLLIRQGQPRASEISETQQKRSALAAPRHGSAHGPMLEPVAFHFLTAAYKAGCGSSPRHPFAAFWVRFYPVKANCRFTSTSKTRFYTLFLPRQVNHRLSQETSAQGTLEQQTRYKHLL